MKKNKLGSSFNKQEEILNFLKSDLPEVFSEGKIDCKKLKQTLGEDVDDGNERYGLSWAGKSNCFRVIQEQTTATLKPAKDESVDFDQTKNLFIEGDNLEVLKVLQRSYYGKVKMIYIDPPYNTGGDFIYNDNFRKAKKDEMIDTGEMNGEGDLTRADGLSVNRKDSNGHFHSDWLNMMYPRLFLARNLLRQDGVIFVSIDDNEVHNLRMMMNEIFGENNFVGNTIRVSNSAKNNSNYLSITHDFSLVYAKNIDILDKGWMVPKRNAKEFEKIANRLIKSGMANNEIENELKELTKYPKFYDFDHYYYCDKNGVYRTDNSGGVENGNFETDIVHPKTKKICAKPAKGWRYSDEKIKEMIEKNLFHFGEDESTIPLPKRYLNEYLESIPSGISFFDTQKDSNYFKQIKLPFDFPKPLEYIKYLIQMTKFKDGVFLDFFSGSGTTAQAVMELNAEDEGSRKWICVQIPELTDEESEAYKAEYKTIAEIGKERIKRAGKKIKEESKNKVDLGFKVLKLDKSNFKIWQGKFENTKNLLNAMAEFVDNVQKGSKEENILFELILKSGLDLDVSIEEKKIGGDKCYLLDGGKLIVYLGKKITKEMAEEIQKAKPEKFICLDGCFQNNDQLKTNISLQMEQEKIDFKVI